jgi:hypothetical protein
MDAGPLLSSDGLLTLFPYRCSFGSALRGYSSQHSTLGQHGVAEARERSKSASSSSTAYPSQRLKPISKWIDIFISCDLDNKEYIYCSKPIKITSLYNMASALDVSSARSRFPALQQEQVYMDNAGG